LHYFQRIGKDKAGEQTIGTNGNDDIEKDRIKTGGSAMGKKHFSELSDHDHLNQGPQGDDQDKQGIARHRKAPDRFCCQAAYTRQ
jgi:hypothetical protein